MKRHLPQTGVIPAKAGIQIATRQLDSGLRRNDGSKGIAT